MKQSIIINADAYETRIAILEDGELAELLVERADQRRHVGDIYKGRINAVLPGMQAAFVDLGLPKTGFLHASDLAESLSGLEDISDLEENGDRRRRRAPAPKIEDHLKKGQEILVQITKESIGTRGRASPSSSACRGASACSCRAWITSASRAASRTAASASASRPSSAT